MAGERTGANPTDRGKRGTKRSLLTEGHDVPLGLVVDNANRHDMKLTQPTLASVVIERPEPTTEHPQHLCLDKGYDYYDLRELVDACGYAAHIRTPGESKAARKELPGYRARRWMVERAHSSMNRFRRLFIRWEKDTENYLAMLHFACDYIAFRAAKVMG